MKIATWNVERLRHKSRLYDIVSACNSTNADILVLTETDIRIQPDFKYCYSTRLLHDIRPDFYAPTENRVSIYTNYECIHQYETFDEHTSVCVGLNTPCGELLVYGTIIGIYGNRDKMFMEDLECQMKDLNRLAQYGVGLCFCGDYNCSFADNYYFTNKGRDALLSAFHANNFSLLTGATKECIDHIAVSIAVCRRSEVQIEQWNIEKKLSDHKGISVTFDY